MRRQTTHELIWRSADRLMPRLLSKVRGATRDINEMTDGARRRRPTNGKWGP